jgi:hypothetical protein
MKKEKKKEKGKGKGKGKKTYSAFRNAERQNFSQDCHWDECYAGKELCYRQEIDRRSI